MKLLQRLTFLAVLVSFTSASALTEFDVDSIKTICKRVIKYSLSSTMDNTWIEGAYYTGVMGMLEMTSDTQYLDTAKAWATYHQWLAWNKSTTTTTGDDQCCFQTYCEIFMQDTSATNSYMYQPALANLNHMFNVAPLGGHQWGWCDLLFMAPPAITRVALVSKTPALLDSMTTYYWNTSKTLYDTVAHLYYRDPTFIYPAAKTADGSKVFWSRGNGWVEAGLARVLRYLPANYASRAKYVKQFQDLSAALKAVQGGDGLWRTSLYDTLQYPDPEMSGTCFFAFGMAWGINNGILDRTTFEPTVRKAWSGMVKNVAASGALMRVQDVGTQPGPTTVNMSKPYAEGAFCLTGKEMITLVTTTGVHQSVASQQITKKAGVTVKQTLVNGTQHFVIPAGATGYSVYNLAGQALYSSRRLDAAHAETAVLPAELRNASQAVLVKFDYSSSR